MKRRRNDVKTRVDNDECMKNAKIDRDDNSMNDLNKIDRRDFFIRNDFLDESHLMN
jgi:hypothetical protein